MCAIGKSGLHTEIVDRSAGFGSIILDSLQETVDGVFVSATQSEAVRACSRALRRLWSTTNALPSFGTYLASPDYVIASQIVVLPLRMEPRDEEI